MDEPVSLLDTVLDQLVSEQKKSTEQDNDVIADYLPQIGMEFDSENDAYHFYNYYGGQVGFSIRKEYANKHRITKKITSRKFVCFKEGQRGQDKRDCNTKNPRAEIRTGCLAHMKISLDRTSGKYRVFSFEPQHNHPLHTKACSHMMSSQRKMSSAQVSFIDLADDSGIKPKNSHEFLSRQAGGKDNLGYILKDHKNYLRSKRKKNLEYGETGSLLRYFQQQSLENPSFYYALQLDVEEQITNIFWCDAKMIMDYSYFGDVIAFDTTYRTNNESRPLALFAGFNNYREIVIFGAALLLDETTESFSWLFETFLEAMSNKKPKTIFTDQDHAIAKAVSLVIPDAYHGLCTWHLLQNALKNVGCLLDGEEGFLGDFSRCIYDIEEADDLNVAWESMLDRHNLRESTWMAATFQLKEKWARAYMKRTFSAGIRSTQLSESINAILKSYLTSELDLIRFFNHFERAVNDKRYKELEAEYSARQKLPRLKMKRSPMLNQAAAIYTPPIFEEFQLQYDIYQAAFIKEHDETPLGHEYVIGIYGESEERKVTTNLDGSTISCSCRKFESYGILCSHALKVLDVKNHKLLPSQYILKRWTTDAKNEIVKDIGGKIIQSDMKLEVANRYKSLCPNLVKLASRSAECEKTFKLVAKVTSELSRKVEDILKNEIDADRQNTEINETVPTTNEEVEIDNETLATFTAKGLKKKKSSCKGKRRPKSWIEKLPKRKKGRQVREKKPKEFEIAHPRDVDNAYIPQPIYPMAQSFYMPHLIIGGNEEIQQPVYDSRFDQSLKGSMSIPCQTLIAGMTQDGSFAIQEHLASQSTGNNNI